jgi:hypothetical protein
MIITAIFTGENSLGYVNGTQYTLRVKNSAIDKDLIIYRLKDGKGICQYSNAIKFFDNWDNIQRVKL